MDNYLKKVYGFYCSVNKMYLKNFLIKNNIFYRKYSEDRLFTFKCVVHARRYAKIPNPTFVYRSLQISTSRQPANLEDLRKLVKGMNGMAKEFNEFMSSIDFFNENPEYKFAVMEIHLLSLVVNCIMPKYYRNNQFINSETLKAVYEELESIYGDDAPLVSWLFHRFHTLTRISVDRGSLNAFTKAI